MPRKFRPNFSFITEDEAIAALFYDAIEDHDGEAARQVINEQFGDSGVNTIDGCTASNKVPKPLWKQRKAQDLQQVRSATGADAMTEAFEQTVLELEAWGRSALLISRTAEGESFINLWMTLLLIAEAGL